MEITDAEIREMARERVSFRIHAATYVLVNLFLVFMWTRGDAETYWPLWAHVGWGIGLAFHAYGAYGGGASAVRREEQKIRRTLGR